MTHGELAPLSSAQGAPLVELAAAVVRDAAGWLDGVTLRLGGGVHAFLGAPSDGTAALVRALCGAASPLRGRVLVRGRPPDADPAVRRRIGSLLPEPALPDAPSVAAAVRLAMRLRGERGDRYDAALDPLGLGRLHAVPTRRLDEAQARGVELGLALSCPDPLALSLHEPLAHAEIGDPGAVIRRLREVGAKGASVVVATSSVDDALAVGDWIHVLSRGRILRTVPRDLGAELRPGRAAELVITLERGADGSSPARALAEALGWKRAVTAARWDDRLEPGVVRVAGDDLDACAVAVAQAVSETGVRVVSLVPSSPGLDEVRAAAAGAATRAFLDARGSEAPAPQGAAWPRGGA